MASLDLFNQAATCSEMKSTHKDSGSKCFVILQLLLGEMHAMPSAHLCPISTATGENLMYFS